LLDVHRAAIDVRAVSNPFAAELRQGKDNSMEFRCALETWRVLRKSAKAVLLLAIGLVAITAERFQPLLQKLTPTS
jgi:hypothetical protein